MKNRFLLILMVSLLMFCSTNYGQDYRSHQSGNWNVAGNWEKYNGSEWVYPAPEYPPLVSPYISSRVTIQSGHTITATGNVGGTTGGILEILQGGVLEMGSYPIRGTSQYSKFPEIIVGGTLNTASYVSSITFTVEATGKFTTSYIGLRGWWYSGYAPTTLALNGEIEFSGATEQKIPAYNYTNLTISGSGDKVPVETEVFVEGTLNIVSGSRLVLAGAILYCNGTGIVLNGTLDGAASSIEFNGVSQNLSGTGTFGSLTDAFAVGTTTATNLTISNPNLITLNALIIIPGSTLNISPVSKVTVLGTLDTGDGLLLKASSSSPYTCASLIVDPLAEVIGNINSEIYLTGGGSSFLNNYKWHYISSPFTSLPITAFTAVTKNLAQFIEGRPTTALMMGWVTYNGYSYYDGASTTLTFNSLDPGKGYDFYDNVNNSLTISGTPNITDVTIPIGFSGLPTEFHGFNLLGNPFTSGLNWDLIASNPAYPLNTSKGIYFTRDNQQCSYVNGVGIPSDVTGIIPPMQGFFVRTKASGNSITLPAAARTHANIHQRYKGSADIPLIRLAIAESTDPADEAVVRFDEQAKTYLDNDFDAEKMFLAPDKTTIHTTSDGVRFSINGLPIPSEGSITEIPVVVNLTTDGIHKINATQIQGMENFNILLKDNITGISTDLKSSPEISFSAPLGSSDRFVLRIANVLTGIEDPYFSPDDFSIYDAYGFITVLPLADRWSGMKASLKVFDLSGKMLDYIPTVELRKNTPFLIKSPGASGMYILEIRSGVLRHTGKIIVR